MEVWNILGIAVLLLLYLVILAFGILAARWFKRTKLDGSTGPSASLVADRKLGSLVGIFTMTATAVGGGFINGTAESVATWGMAWTLAPFGILLGLSIGGVFYAKKMRAAKYVTMLDPLQQQFGHTMTGLLYMAALCGDLFWSASILAALGTSLSVIIDLNVVVAIVTSAAIAVTYTMFGQMISVAYTDVLQLIFVTVGLVLCLPFAMTNEHVKNIATTKDMWLGSINTDQAAVWTDLLLAMIFGTIPWQSYFQRVLSVKTAKQAQLLSIAGAFGSLLLAIPPALVGCVAVSADWNATELRRSPMALNRSSLVLPQVLKHFTPKPVSILGLGAVTAAVMSSIDSAFLSSSSLFTHNIYKLIFRKKASDAELQWVQRVALLVIGVVASVLSIFSNSVYGLFILAADFVYVIMFPQLSSVIFVPYCNAYGSVTGFVIGLILRLGAGEPYLSISPLIHYPFYDEVYGQLFPFRTFTMLVALVGIVTVSHVTRIVFLKKFLPIWLDVFGCFKEAMKRTGPLSQKSINERPCNPDEQRLFSEPNSHITQL